MMRSERGLTILPPGMTGLQLSDTLSARPLLDSNLAPLGFAPSMEDRNWSLNHPPSSPAPIHPLLGLRSHSYAPRTVGPSADIPHASQAQTQTQMKSTQQSRVAKRSSIGNGLYAFSHHSSPSIRAVTPELPEPTDHEANRVSSPHVSPRSSVTTPASRPCRKGLTLPGTDAGFATWTPTPRSLLFRPRNHTMDSTNFRQHTATTVATAFPADICNRVGSVPASSSTGALLDDGLSFVLHSPHQTTQPESAPAYPVPTPPPTFWTDGRRNSPSGTANTELTNAVTGSKVAPPRRLVKRTSSHPISPLVIPPPSIDCLPLPIPTEDSNRTLCLMRTLCGRMRGEVEYQTETGGPWHSGIACIDDETGHLVFDPANTGYYHTVLIPDLRGCRVLLVSCPGVDTTCIKVRCSPMAKTTHDTTSQQNPLILRPLNADDLDLWLAALLCWQQLRPSPVRLGGRLPAAVSSVPLSRPDLRHLRTLTHNTSIIKVGNVILWDKGPPADPRAVVRRPSTRNLSSSTTSSPNGAIVATWRSVPCTLQDNGELRLLSDDDGGVLATIELPQLSRCAIQHLDRTVLDEPHCIALFPIYLKASVRVSIYRPVFIALQSREAFEVWFVLLRAFAIPQIMTWDSGSDAPAVEMGNLQDEDVSTDTFRIKKSILLRLTEARLTPLATLRSTAGDLNHTSGHHAPEPALDRAGLEVGDGYLAEVLLNGEVRARTAAKSESNNPFWREDAEFQDLPIRSPRLSVLLKRVEGSVDGSSTASSIHLPLSGTTPRTSVSTSVPFGSTREAAIGSVEIPLDRIEIGRDHEERLPILGEARQCIGTMFVRVHYEELAVLISTEYQPLSELLHYFPANLTLQIAAALPGTSLRRLSDIFLSIFQVTRSAVEWLKVLAEAEIDAIWNHPSAIQRRYRFARRLPSSESDGVQSNYSSAAPSTGVSVTSTATTSVSGTATPSPTSESDKVHREIFVREMGRSLAGEANLLFRGNSLVTQALESHMRRLGTEYLEEALRDKITEIDELNLDCEVDPSRVLSGDDVSQHWTVLKRLTGEVWQCIADSAERVPTELRLIFRHVRAVAEDRYGDFLETVPYTSVSGFFFLRFICPAILSPKLFGLLRDHPRPHAQRTLTLIAKGLQKLANLSSFGRREEWMDPMNWFLSQRRQSVRDFLDRVCVITAYAERSTIAVPAPYSTPITILGRLSPLRREGFPSLPYLVDHAYSFAALVRLWTDANPLADRGSTPDHSADLAVFNDMCFALQRRSDICLSRISAGARMMAEDDLDYEVLVGEYLLPPRLCLDSQPVQPVPQQQQECSTSQQPQRRLINHHLQLLIHPLHHHSHAHEEDPSRALGKTAAKAHRTHGVRSTRTILSGIMRIGRAESPDASTRVPR